MRTPLLVKVLSPLLLAATMLLCAWAITPARAGGAPCASPAGAAGDAAARVACGVLPLGRQSLTGGRPGSPVAIGTPIVRRTDLVGTWLTYPEELVAQANAVISSGVVTVLSVDKPVYYRITEPGVQDNDWTQWFDHVKVCARVNRRLRGDRDGAMAFHLMELVLNGSFVAAMEYSESRHRFALFPLTNIESLWMTSMKLDGEELLRAAVNLDELVAGGSSSGGAGGVVGSLPPNISIWEYYVDGGTMHLSMLDPGVAGARLVLHRTSAEAPFREGR